MKTRIMAVRHGEKGNGKETGLKNHLSPKGESDARALGSSLPESMKSAPITHVGGSPYSRSLFTALLIALSSGADPLVLSSRMELGLEDQFWAMTSKDAFNAAMLEHENNMMAATKAILAPEDYAMLQAQMVHIILEHGKLGGNIVLGTHNPWIQMLYEAVLGSEYSGNAAELDYVVVDVEDGKITLVETSLK